VSDVRAWTALASLLVSVGCNASISHDDLHGHGGGAQTSDGSTGAAGGPNTFTLGRDAIAQRCDASQLAPPQLRRLTGVELERTLRDIFPSLATDWSGVQVAAKSDFATGVHWVLVAMIQSPSTVYRSELGTADAGGRKLTAQELASELSYTYGGTAPSADLLAAAERGDFATPEARIAKAKELLATPAGREQLHQFLAEWSGYGKVASKTKTTVVNFEALRTSMQQETKLFFDEAVVNRKGGVRELLTADYTFVDSSLSALYGFGAAIGSDFAQVARPAGQGLGLLAQGSMLSGSAHADASSPTLRGLVVYERLLCHQKPPVPPNVAAIGAATPGAKTTRERYEIAHRSSPTCATCHQFFDPIGFGLEHFDEAGRYRADEGGLTIDATGQALAYPATNVVFSFDGEDDLAQKLADRPEVADCVSGLAAAYAFAGAGGRTCLAEDARAAFARGDLGVLDYFAELSGSPSFVERAP